MEVHHEITGASDLPVLVLAGPLGSTLEIWDPLVEALAERFQVLRYDHRGHGRSPAPGGTFTIVDLAVDVVALLDRLSIERAALAVCRLGGMVGICLAANVPERLSSPSCAAPAPITTTTGRGRAGRISSWAGPPG